MATHAPILSAEDEPTDRLILQMAFSKSGLPNALIFVQDGQEVVDYLAGRPPYGDRLANPVPGLLLLDVKMPRMDGFDVLAWLAAQPELRHLPVVVLSSSSNDADVERARGLGARDYLVKPHDHRELIKMLRGLADHWLAPVSVPAEPSQPQAVDRLHTAPASCVREQSRLRGRRVLQSRR